MALNVVVCVKQVIDPETPVSAFKVDSTEKKVVLPADIPPVINGFDENAVEAALRIKDAGDANVTVLSLGTGFIMDVIKKPLSMGVDQLVLMDDPAVADLDAFGTAYALTEAIRKLGSFDVILCGRQASDWDNAQVPMGIAEMLGVPCITVASKVEVVDGVLTVHRTLIDGYEVVQAPLPALVTVSNELGEARYPTLRGIMTASRKTPTVWSVADVGLSEAHLARKVLLTDLFMPVGEKRCEFIEGEDEADVGRRLALRLREANLI